MSKQPRQIVFAIGNAPKRGRRSSSKSRYGCLTCKARHIKCTEERPECTKCTLSGRKCAGYAPQVDRRTSPMCPTGPNSARNDLSLTIDSALGLPSKHVDRRYLDHFRSRSAVALSRLGDQEFWGDIVLRLCASRPMIQFAVLALSAQHEAFSNDGIISCAASTYGLDRYNKGIKCLNQILANANSEFDLLEVVVACSLFAAFEILQGNGNGARRHGRGALQILLSQIAQRGDSGELDDVLDSKPAKFLIRLDVETASYGGFENVHELAVKPFSPPTTMREHRTARLSPRAESHGPASIFEGVVKAREELYTLLARNYHFLRNVADAFRCSNHQEAFDAGFFPNDPQIPDEVYQWQKMLLTNMSNWHESLEALVEPSFSATRDEETKYKAALTREYASISVACVFSYMSVYTCLVSEEEAQGLYDNLITQFRCLVRHAEMIIFPEASMSTGTEDHGGFLLEMGGVIQALAFTALKCRDWEVRNRAMFLLSVSGRSGGWDGQNLARLVRYVVDYEERQAREERELRYTVSGTVEDSEQLPWIPLCARVSHLSLELDQVNSRVELWMHCSRGREDECVSIENW